VAAAVAEEIADYHTFAILARQYGWMKNLFTAAAARLEKLIAANDVPIRAIHYVPAATRHSLIERAMHARRRSTCTMIITRDGTTRHG